MQGNPYGQAYPYDVALYAAVQELHRELVQAEIISDENVTAIPQVSGVVPVITALIHQLKSRIAGVRDEVCVPVENPTMVCE